MNYSNRNAVSSVGGPSAALVKGTSSLQQEIEALATVLDNVDKTISMLFAKTESLRVIGPPEASSAKACSPDNISPAVLNVRNQRERLEIMLEQLATLIEALQT